MPKNHFSLLEKILKYRKCPALDHSHLCLGLPEKEDDQDGQKEDDRPPSHLFQTLPGLPGCLFEAKYDKFGLFLNSWPRN